MMDHQGNSVAVIGGSVPASPQRSDSGSTCAAPVRFDLVQRARSNAETARSILCGSVGPISQWTRQHFEDQVIETGLVVELMSATTALLSVLRQDAPPASAAEVNHAIAAAEQALVAAGVVL